MYVYIDESGNTGRNMFDKKQPYFLSLAVMYNGDFHNEFSNHFAKLASSMSIDSIHANRINAQQFDMLCLNIYNIIKDIDLKFSYVFIDKMTHVATKMFETIFDAWENLAVHRAEYYIGILRKNLLCNFVDIVDEHVLKIFWNDCLNPKNKLKTNMKKSFVSALKILKSNINPDLDQRIREIFNDAFDWAIKNNDNITYFVDDDKIRILHAPNVAFFVKIMENIEIQYNKWKSSKCTIIHDRQTEFAAALSSVHKFFSNPQMPEYLNIPLVQNIKLRLLENSTFQFQASPNNVGLQLCDMCLSVISRGLKCKYKLPDNQKMLNDHVYNNLDSYYILNINSIRNEVMILNNCVMNMDIGENELKKGEELINLEERRRKERMHNKNLF